MTLGRFVLILFFIAFAFITSHLTLSFVHKQDIHQLSSGEKKCVHCNLNKADLAKWDLRGYDLTQASMVGADLRCANLEKAILAGATMKFANLTGANLEGADLLFTNLEQVVWEDGTDCEELADPAPLLQ
ncbi:MAG TPA: pentapeptide repeat-containing protein [Gammaproteobacteria bacterium]|nr:pentapeptide repeat-containing protein [Gammaproteobacteria bacterium]